jgi:hypothetical protein
LATFLGVAASAEAGFFPQITFDSREGPGQNLFTTQGLLYEAGVSWAGSAKALAITFDGVNYTPLVNGTFDAHAAFDSTSVQNGVVMGHFVPANDGQPSFVLADDTGVLLSGKYYTRTILGAIGSDQGTSVSTFRATGGSLLPLFEAATNGDGLINFDLFNVAPAFTATSFDNNFESQFAGIIAPTIVVEPSSLVLLALGVGGAGFSRVRRKLAR